MRTTTRLRGRRCRLAVTLPLAAITWTLTATPAFAAGPHQAASPSGQVAATNAHADADAGGNGGGNGGVGNGNGNGNAKHDTGSGSTSGSTAAPSTPVAPSAPAPSTGTGSQPLSVADANSGGANGQCPGGPYCSSGVGKPSGNGNGNGNAVGKPCAGCVGKADNKNPKGQKPNGSDHNNGYECDGNSGIGRTNPAHTGCSSTPPPPVCPAPNTVVNGVCTPPGPPPPPPPRCLPPNTVVNGVCTPPNPPTPPSGPVCTAPSTLVDGVCTPPSPPTTPPTGCVATAANNFCQPIVPQAQCPAGAVQANGACVLGERFTRKPSVQGERVVRTPAAQTLPFTGADVAGLTAMGGLGLGLGLVLLCVAGRRRRATT